MLELLQPSRTTSHGRGTARHQLMRALVAAPDRLVLAFFWTSLVVAVCILLGIFVPWVVLPVAAVTVVLCWRLAPGPLPTRAPHAWGSFIALAIALLWFVVQLPYASRYIVVLRDPGFLTLAGLWLSENPGPNMPVGSAEAVAAAVPGVSPYMAPYYLEDGLLHVQGAKLLPGLVAMPGWFAGERGVLAGNLLIGALALIAVYGLARRMMGPLWGLVPVLALACAVPLAVLSRAAYTEPMTVVVIFGGLTLAWSAFESGRWWHLALAGAMIGSSALSRIDGAASVIGLIGALGLVAGASLAPRVRRRYWIGAAAAALAAVLMVVLGYLDLATNSRYYLRDLSGQYSSLIAVLVAVTLFALLLPLGRWADPLRTLVHRHRRGLSFAAAAVAVVVAVVLFTRPWWYTAHLIAAGSPYADFIERMQAAEGLPVDGTRSYDELSVNWLAWYLGWPAVVLGLGGVAALVQRAIRRRDPRLLVVAAVIAAPTALYLWRVSITPDQVWAIRRFLPVSIPGLLVIATWTAREIIGRWGRSTRAASGRAVVAAGVAGALIVAPSLTTWGNLFTTVEMGGRLEELRRACALIPDDRVVYVRYGNPPYLATLTTMCGVDGVELQGPPTQEQLAEIRHAWGDRPLTIMTFRSDLVPWTVAEPAPVSVTQVTSWPSRLSSLPSEPLVTPSTLWAGTILEDGSVEPLPAP